MVCVLIKKISGHTRDTEKMKMKREIEAFHLQVEEHQDCQDPPETRKRQRRTLSLQREHGPADTLIVTLLSSRTMREYVSLTSSYPVCSTSLKKP